MKKQILSNSAISHGLGLILIAGYLNLTSGYNLWSAPDTITYSTLSVFLTYIATASTLPQISKYLLVERKYYILPVLLTMFAILTGLIALTRIEYSRSILIHGFFASFVWLYISSMMRRRYKKLKLSAIENFDITIFKENKSIEVTPLGSNREISSIQSGLVVDLHKELSSEDSKFVADCSINNIPVFHSESIREMVEGKVQTSHISENAIGTLNPNPIYFSLKRVWESAIIIITLPITLPVMAITACLIKIENPGPAIFTQERVGQSGKTFKIYKFRSMTIKKCSDTDKFATEEKDRITRVGKFIRKVRIDELPQFFNVLKGEMALIGPRPEQESFVKKFEQEISFYGYRHMVKPGITGWAQTVQGYADDTDSTREKLAHDLYYIKHLSFWLDMNIVIKTIKTMLTGFGAK
ncbi:exopolysaccharide biosynthesis polyprenyl glycosylphosphotransferase [Vibrio sp. SCSIO 43135]|uniref:exopolysaccharide biosynthesis polyprenyl glycosylphosphotransferase n=1 Tax=Vibrio sp. SCSIO 43135 TaxID=2819096 RepID=UPI0020752C4F|nr:exopolysaccharide biosynthesis polyprenyl glycosylphosphotransferase [Vibrio sp. SCSIO 43135]